MTAEDISFVNGTEVVSSIALVCNHEDIAYLSVDMKSKYCYVNCCISTDIDDELILELYHNENAMYLNSETQEQGKIVIKNAKGWNLLCSKDGRYTIDIVLVKI